MFLRPQRLAAPNCQGTFELARFPPSDRSLVSSLRANAARVPFSFVSMYIVLKRSFNNGDITVRSKNNNVLVELLKPLRLNHCLESPIDIS